ncbi:tryptophan--tRNA ligase [Candidatus Saccharibacteria bacterium]|nr:tryptophan--tRNA ligase [Candidatus Saccharibacteria bacterium]
MTKPVILTGLRANNDLTLGNYFGGILPIIKMAKDYSSEFQINMFIPDLHSFTTPIDHTKLQAQILHNARLFVAAGLPLDNPNIHLYRQSHVSAHSELTWILDCFTGMGEMARMTQFKDKTSQIGEDRVSIGLFNYPVLMAADILLYGARYVPVGEDQTQHLEFTRDIAERMNKKFGNLLTPPEPVAKQYEFFGKSKGLRIMDLVDPTKKMSKSDEQGRGVIFLGDDPQAAAKKVMSATTDDLAYVRYDKTNQPGISNLLEILSLLRGISLEDTVKEFEGHNKYGDFKRAVADEVVIFLTNFQKALAECDDRLISAKLKASEELMRQQAQATLYRVQKAIGLR